MDQREIEVQAQPYPSFMVFTPAEADPLELACREMAANALDYCQQKTRLPGRESVFRALRAGDRATHDYFRYGLAKEVGRSLGQSEAAVKAVYLFEPELESGEGEEAEYVPPKQLELIVLVSAESETLAQMIESIGESLATIFARENGGWLGPDQATRRSFLRVEILDDEDVQERRGKGGLLASIYTQPIKVWSRFVIRLNPEYCGQCRVCYNVCPYDAIAISPEGTVAKIDVAKCQLCGICYSACPAGAIEAAYYDLTSLVRDVQSSTRSNGLRAIALTCRGSTPPAEELEQIIGEAGVVPICLPCVGRTPPEFFLKALSMGVERIAVVPCEDNHCRFEDGNRVIRRRILLLRSLLQDMNYDPNLLILSQGQQPVATVDPELCAGCGTCIAICPKEYSAIHAEIVEGRDMFVAKIDPELCQGCGLCVVACPSKAIEISKFTNLHMLSQISETLAAPVQNGNPRILGFRCNWSVLGDAHAPLERQSYSSQNIEIIPVPCAGRVDPIHVLWALLNGADGVLLVGCPSGDCRYGSGSDEADDRMGTLKGLLDAHGFDSRRLQLERLRRDTPDAFDEAMRSFASKIRRLGRLPALPS